MTDPSVARHPAPAPGSTTEPNRFDAPHLEMFSNKAARDSHMLEYEALAGGLDTVRYDKLTFFAGSHSRPASIGFRWTSSIETSRSASFAAGNKQATRVLLERAGAAVPPGRSFSLSRWEGAVEYASRLGWPVVVKPQAGTGGRGVTTDIRSEDDLRRAIDVLRDGRHRAFVVERHIAGGAYRFLVLRDRVLSVVFRRPASVVGDGVSTVAELAHRQNDLRSRMHRLQTMPRPIDDTVRATLEQQGLELDSVPDAGRRVFLSNIGSRSQGGDSFEVLDETHPTLLDMAVRAVRAIPGLMYSGVDFLIEDHTLPIDAQQAAICEVNSSPASGSHHFPLYGPPRNVSRELVIDQCRQFGLPWSGPADELNLEVVMRGVVKGVGYRQWLAELCQALGVSGWVDYTGSGVVARLSGEAPKVAAVASLAAEGPTRAKPAVVTSRHVTSPLRRRRHFVVRRRLTSPPWRRLLRTGRRILVEHVRSVRSGSAIPTAQDKAMKYRPKAARRLG